MKQLLLFILIILFYACNNKPNTKENSTNRDINTFFEINYEQMLKNEQVVKLSQFALNVEYIKLETNDTCMIRSKARYFFSDSLIFVDNHDNILKFSRDGRFLQKIGKPGRGPGEIDLIRIMSVLPDKRYIAVQLNGIKRIIFFSFNGDVIKTINYDSDIFCIKVLPDEKLITYEPGVRGSEKYTFCLLNQEWDTLSMVRNYSIWDRPPSRIMVSYSTFETFYFSQDKYHFKAMYNDTVYYVLADRVYPEYFINMGHYKLPEELRPERLGIEQFRRFEDNQYKYYFANVFESSKRIFLTSYNYGESSVLYFLYDKSEQEGFLLKSNNNSSTGFINDWDGGIDFYPLGAIDDNQVFMPINTMDIKNKLVEIEAGEKEIRYPDKHKQLVKMLSNTSITDNPVIMVVSIK